MQTALASRKFLEELYGKPLYNLISNRDFILVS
jgi:hypothetical protein